MEHLDVLLLNAHRRYLDTSVQFGGFLGIYILSAFLRREGYEAKGLAESLNVVKSRIDDLCSKNAVSMIGLYCDFDNVTENIFLSKYVKNNYHLPVIVGGPQATSLGEDFFTRSCCDAVVRYEGELTVLELANFFLEGVGELGFIKGIAYRDASGLIHINPERPLIQNLDALPFVDEQCYLEPKYFYGGLSIMTGRGCPFHCAFCHEGAHTRKVRFRSVGNVLAEIDAYLAKWDRDGLYILLTDDTFTLDSERVREICDGIAERQKKKPFRWFCEGHVHTLYQHPEMIEYLARGHCTRIQLGIEAGTEPVLKSYGKHTTPDEIFEVVRRCRDAGIQQIYGNIILSGAHFSREIYKMDKDFALRLLKEGKGVVELGVVPYWPLPETPMTLHPENYGIKIVDDEFVTSSGDWPQVETEELDRFTVAGMMRDLEQAISDQMIRMMENWEVPSETIMGWFFGARDRRTYGGWMRCLMGQEILFPYYEMLFLGEGKDSIHTEQIAEAHPLRVAALFKYLQRVDDGTVEILGERFSSVETEIVLLTSGKLSVKEISERAGTSIADVMSVLGRLESRHLIVYTM